ncbi:MAG: PAS domain S-box protein, partial [Desulfobacteraceae bacterium]
MADKDNNNYNVSGLNPDLPETFLNPADKKNIPKKIQHFENLISEFSTVIIDTPEEYLEDELSHWLKIFVEFLRVDRCIVNEYQDDQKVIRLLLDYTVPEVDVDPLVKDYKTSEDVFRELKKGNIIKVEKIPEDLPQAFRGGLIERERTKSIIIFPLSIGYKIFGSFLFSSFRKRYNWSDDFVRKMKLIGEIIANTILRIRSHKKFLHEMEQRKSLEKRYSAILKDANVGFIILDLNHNILEVNDEYCRMSGYNREELLTKKIWEIDASMDPEKLGKEARVLEKERVIRIITSHRRKDGSLFDVEVSSNFIEEEGIACTFVRDITDLSKAREQMEKRLEFEELVSGFSAELINIAPDHIYDELNKWLKKFVEFLKVDRGIVVEHLYEENMIHLLLNYTVPEINVPLVYSHKPPTSIRENIKRGLTIKAEKIPDDLPEALKGGIIERENTKSIIIVPITASNKVIGNLTFLNYRKERKWPDELVSRIKLIGEILANAIMRERSHKTLLKETENRKLIEEKYALVLENANVGFWMLDFNRNILEVNDEYCRMSGYSRDELLSMKVVDIVVNKEPDRESWFLKRMKSEGSVHHEITHLKKDGSLLELDVSSALLGENILFSFMRDITELNQSKREREERLKFEKLISEFSAALVNVKVNDIKMKLDIWLKRFAQLLNIDR